jgi:hypothetical protein
MKYPSIVEAKDALPANQMQYYRTQKHINPILQDLAPNITGLGSHAILHDPKAYQTNITGLSSHSPCP